MVSLGASTRLGHQHLSLIRWRPVTATSAVQDGREGEAQAAGFENGTREGDKWLFPLRKRIISARWRHSPASENRMCTSSAVEEIKEDRNKERVRKTVWYRYLHISIRINLGNCMWLLHTSLCPAQPLAAARGTTAATVYQTRLIPSKLFPLFHSVHQRLTTLASSLLSCTDVIPLHTSLRAICCASNVPYVLRVRISQV